MVARLVMVALLVTTGAACKHNKHGNTTVQNRAMFDFPCPKDQLTLRVADVQGARKLATQIAAYGCDKKAVYVYVPDLNTWVINGVVADVPEDFDLEATLTENTDSKRAQKKGAKAEKRGDMGAADAAPVEATPAGAAPAESAPADVAPEPTPDPS